MDGDTAPCCTRELDARNALRIVAPCFSRFAFGALCALLGLLLLLSLPPLLPAAATNAAAPAAAAVASIAAAAAATAPAGVLGLGFVLGEREAPLLFAAVSGLPCAALDSARRRSSYCRFASMLAAVCACWS